MNQKSLFLYTSFLLVVYGPISVQIAIGLMLLLCVVQSIQDQQTVVLLPFYLYPFMFLLRARDPDNVILTVLPDVSAMFMVAYVNAKNQTRSRSGFIFGILILYCCVSLVVPLLHMMEIVYLPLVIRQYLLPVVFLGTLIKAVRTTNGLIEKLYKTTFHSFAVVATMSLLNYLSLVTVEPSITALHPFLNYSELDPANAAGRSIAGGQTSARNNLFTGGALGSSAAIFAYLSFSPFLCKNIELNIGHLLYSLVLAVSSILSSSFSIANSIIIGLSLLLLKVNKMLAIFGFLLVLPIIISAPLYFDTSAIDYFNNTVVTDFIQYLNKIEINAILFGSGPRFTSAGFEFEPANFIVDVGVARVFVELGLIAFLPFLCFILFVLTQRFRDPNNLYLTDYGFFFGFCVLFLVCVHANMTTLPPFFPLFAIVICGLIPSHQIASDKR